MASSAAVRPPARRYLGPAASWGVLLAAAGMVLAAAVASADESTATRADFPGPPRRATLLWRDDPRAPADAPAGVDVPPARRVPRRVQRRSMRRRLPADAASDAPPGTPEAMPRRTIMERPPAAAGALTADRGAGFDTDLDAVLDADPAPPAEPASGSGITIHRDQPYGRVTAGQPAHARQRFDIHLPAGCHAGGMPLVVWIHGESWRDGSKADCPIAWLAGEGYAVASIGYRLSDTAVFPAQLDDCREAIASIQRQATVWGIDPDRVAVVGSGGGGLLAALVGLAGEAAVDPALPRIAAVCAVAAPASLTTLGREQDRAGSAASRLVGGPLPEFREAAQRASPQTHVSTDDPPVLLVHGSDDTTIPARQAVDFARALEAAGVDATLVLLPAAGHRPDLRLVMPAGQALLTFLDRVLGPGVRPSSAASPR